MVMHVVILATEAEVGGCLARSHLNTFKHFKGLRTELNGTALPISF